MRDQVSPAAAAGAAGACQVPARLWPWHPSQCPPTRHYPLDTCPTLPSDRFRFGSADGRKFSKRRVHCPGCSAWRSHTFWRSHTLWRYFASVFGGRGRLVAVVLQWRHSAVLPVAALTLPRALPAGQSRRPVSALDVASRAGVRMCTRYGKCL